MDEAEQLADRLVIMDEGKIVAEGAPADLIADHVSREVLELRFDGDAPPLLADHRTEVLADRTLVYVDDADGMLATLHDQGHRLSSSLIRRATLEDVFLSLTGRRLVE